MSFQREVSSVKEVKLGIGQITLESFSSCWQEEWVVLALHCKERRLVSAEILLEGEIERDIALVVAEEV